MNKLAIAFLATASLFTFAGCKKKGGGGSDMVSKYEGFAKKMCDCQDKACADKVNEEFTKWGQEMAKTAGKATNEKPDPDIVKKTTEASTKYSECYTKLTVAGGDMAGSGMAGSAAAGSDTAGSAAAGSDTAGSAAAGSDTAGSAAAGSDTAAPADDTKEETK